jgi:hypothetical protein
MGGRRQSSHEAETEGWGEMEWSVIAVRQRTWVWLERRGLTRDVLRDGIVVWACQRAFVVALLAFWQTMTHALYGVGQGLSVDGLFQPLVSYDGLRYAEIARNGYDSLPQAAYFPLYPLLERAIAPVVGGQVAVAGLLLSNAAALAAFILLCLLVTRDVSAVVARRTLILLAVFPMSMFFMAAYTESLFLLFSVAAFLAMRAQRWLLAGGLIALATLTRATGVLLLIPLALEALACYGPGISGLISVLKTKGRSRFALAFALVLPLVTLLVWRVFLDWHFGVSNALGRAVASSDWGRELSWPWYGITQALLANAGRAALWVHTKATRDLFFTFVWLGCTVAMALRGTSLPRGYTAYAVGSLVLALAFPIHARPYDALNSVDRYMLVVFPCFVFAAQWSIASAVSWRILRIATPLVLIVMSCFFALGGFIG